MNFQRNNMTNEMPPEVKIRRLNFIDRIQEEFDGLEKARALINREDSFGMFFVGGYFKIPGNEAQILHFRKYPTQSPNEALEKAKADGLVQPMAVIHPRPKVRSESQYGFDDFGMGQEGRYSIFNELSRRSRGRQ